MYGGSQVAMLNLHRSLMGAHPNPPSLTGQCSFPSITLFVILAGELQEGTTGWAGHLLSEAAQQEEKRGQSLLQETTWQVWTSAARSETNYRSAEIITKGLGWHQLCTKSSWHTAKPI